MVFENYSNLFEFQKKKTLSGSLNDLFEYESITRKKNKQFEMNIQEYLIIIR